MGEHERAGGIGLRQQSRTLGRAEHPLGSDDDRNLLFLHQLLLPLENSLLRSGNGGGDGRRRRRHLFLDLCQGGGRGPGSRKSRIAARGEGAKGRRAVFLLRLLVLCPNVLDVERALLQAHLGEESLPLNGRGLAEELKLGDLLWRGHSEYCLQQLLLRRCREGRMGGGARGAF